MNLNQILFRQHIDEISRLLDEMSKLTDDRLNALTIDQSDAIPWDVHKNTLRATVAAIIETHMIWLAAFKGDPFPELPGDDASVAKLRNCHDSSGSALLEFIEDIEKNNLWDSEFVDALCDQPKRFVFSAVLAHILVFGIHRRMIALDALRSLGVKGLEYGDPINWLRGKMGEAIYVPECA